jgi:hypothetical protein
VSIRGAESAETDNREEEEDGTNANGNLKVLTCELEINCSRAENCPEALFTWQFNDRPIRSLALGGRKIQMKMKEGGEKQQQQQQQPWHGHQQQQSQLEMPARFMKGLGKGFVIVIAMKWIAGFLIISGISPLELLHLNWGISLINY